MIYSTVKTSRGVDVVRVVAAGPVSLEDAQELTREISAGGKYEHHAILGLVERGADFSAQARQAFTASPVPRLTAIVVSTASLRVMLSFIVRITGSTATTRFFSSEGSALEWLNDALGRAAA